MPKEIDHSSEDFDEIREFIDRKRSNGLSWEAFPKETQEAEDYVKERIADHDFSAKATGPVFLAILQAAIRCEKEQEEAKQQILSDKLAATLSEHEEAAFKLPSKKGLYWQIYRSNIEERFTKEDLLILEQCIFSAAKALRPATQQARSCDRFKGLIVGNVQSGKTGHIGGLMAMAAHRRFNLIIVISGTILSLRKQTEARLFSDLLPKPGKANKTNWKPLEINELKSGRVRVDYKLGVDNSFAQRNFIVSLKHSKWLNGIAEWLEDSANALSKLNILIIDDEADQAGINTKALVNERTAVNQAILRLLKLKACSVHYMGYTATPNANILNEPPGPDSLYPSDFITSLPASNCYFGPKEIFGIDGLGEEESAGLDIVRDVAIEHIAQLRQLQSGRGRASLPASLQEALVWFLCASSARRAIVAESNGRLKHAPTSMLIHTSQRISEHEALADAVSKWLSSRTTSELVALCKKRWDDETQRFAKTKFARQYPAYSRIKNVPDYPTFSQIQQHIIRLLEQKPDHLDLVVDDGKSAAKPAWRENKVHICIDNSKPRGIDSGLKHARLLYPREADQVKHPTSFIVIGGATLSRGLTIEGLVSTYFLRSSSLEDSLMQMGRWFGYRVGYELLPRIWMTRNTRRKFRHMALAEMHLRESLKDLMATNACKPADYRLSVLSHPNYSWLRPTARNKMSAAEFAEVSFVGTNNQTVVFENRAEWLRHNLNVAKQFLGSLGPPFSHTGKCAVWRSVPTEQIAAVVNRMNFSEHARTFNNKKCFVDWLSKYAERRRADGLTDGWSVIAAGIRDPNAVTWDITRDVSVKKVTRSRLAREDIDDSFSVGTLLDQADMFADFQKPPPTGGTLSKQEVDKKRREEFNNDPPPQLIFYCIDKNSRPRGGEVGTSRVDLCAVEDVVGVCVLVPGSRGELDVNKVTVKRDDMDADDIAPDFTDAPADTKVAGRRKPASSVKSKVAGGGRSK
jgi:hypothetical protein